MRNVRQRDVLIDWKCHGESLDLVILGQIAKPGGDALLGRAEMNFVAAQDDAPRVRGVCSEDGPGKLGATRTDQTGEPDNSPACTATWQSTRSTTVPRRQMPSAVSRTCPISTSGLG